MGVKKCVGKGLSLLSMVRVFIRKLYVPKRVGYASYSIRYDRFHGASFIRTYVLNIASGIDNFKHLD